MNISLSEIDAGFIDAPPIYAIAVLTHPMSLRWLQRTVAEIAPARFCGQVVCHDEEYVIAVSPGCFEINQVRGDEEIFGSKRLFNVARSKFGGLGLSDPIGLHAPLLRLTLIHTSDQHYLGVTLSHAAGDAHSLGCFVRRLIALHEQVGCSGANNADASSGSFAILMQTSQPGFYSQVRLKKQSLKYLQDLRSRHASLSSQSLRTAFLLKALHPFMGAQGEAIQVRVPIDLRIRNMGLDLEKSGNCFVDAYCAISKADFQGISIVKLASLITTAIDSTFDAIQREDLIDMPEHSLFFRRNVKNQGFAPYADVICTSFRSAREYFLGLPSVPLSIMDSFSNEKAKAERKIEVLSLTPLPEQLVEV
jgi:hypothetical protein